MSVLLEFYRGKAADLPGRIAQMKLAAVNSVTDAIADIAAAERQFAYIEGEVQRMEQEQSLANGATRR